MTKPLLFTISAGLMSVIGYVIGVFILTQLVRHFPAIESIVFIKSHGSSDFSLLAAARQPMAFMAVTAMCLMLDVVLLGMDQSALKRVLECKSASTRVDLFYTALRLVGGFNVLVFIFSFGSLFWLVNQIHRVLHVAALEHVHSLLIQFAIVWVINTFIAYWWHRFMHTTWMWELHKVHHAAEEMNILTNFRSHPIEQMLSTLTNAFPVALLGASPTVIVAYVAINMVYGSLAHSEIKLKSKWWDFIWITPAAHRIHHSTNPAHFDQNFGVLTVWDYLFGTYHKPDNQRVTYGVEDGETFNQPKHVHELFDNVARWIKGNALRLVNGWRIKQPSPTGQTQLR